MIEIMVVLTIFAILSAVAYPTYTQHIRKGRRADAQFVLLELAQLMEQYYARNNSYTGFTLTSYTSITGRVSSYYDVTLTTQTAQAYTLQATTKGTQDASSESSCKNMTLTHTGARASTNAAGTVTTGCWN